MITGGVTNNGFNFGQQAGNVISGGNFVNTRPGAMVSGFVNNTFWGVNAAGAGQAGNVVTGGNFWNI